MSLLNALREATRTQHEQLHVHPLFAPLTSERVTQENYEAALLCFQHVYTLQEARRHKFQSDPTVPDAPVLEWLETDFKMHGLTSAEIQVDEAEKMEEMLDLESLWGYLYVKQGSTLGGQLMTKMLQRQLGLVGGKTQHFFFGYGEGTGPEWKRFTHCLGDIQNKLDWEKTCASASESFLLIARTADTFHRAQKVRRTDIETPPAT